MAANESYSTKQVLLGLLIVWQILFLLVGNALSGLSNAEPNAGHFEEEAAMLDHVTEGFARRQGHWHDVHRALLRWESVFNFPQGWRMFSASVGDYFTFVNVELRWDDGAPLSAGRPGVRAPVLLPGCNEPADLDHFVRWGPWRFQRYEDYMMDMDLRVEPGETRPQAAERWKTIIATQMGDQWKKATAYLNWRWARHHDEHPDCPQPRQVILIVRTYVIPPPGQHLDEPNVIPVARLTPGQSKAGAWSAIQTYDPQAQRFHD